MRAEVKPPATCGQEQSFVAYPRAMQPINKQCGLEVYALAALFFDEFLPTCKDSLLDELLKLSPDGPIGPCEREVLVQKRGVGWVCGKATQWPKSVLKLCQRFPEYQPSHNVREKMKYGYTPPDDAPLSEWINTELSFAKAKWCGEIEGKKTRKQFKDWLPDYLKNDGLWYHTCPSGDAAREVLRVAYRLSGVIPTGGAK